MNLTSLPNSIILNLFEYFSLIELFQYFSGLDSHFNKLLYQEFQKFHLDLRLLSKRKINEIYQNYIPSIINQIISIHLSNDNETPQQIESFMSRDDYKLHQFLNLQSISISNLQCKQTLEKIITECSNLPYLTHLTLNGCTIEMNESDKQDINNKIRSLSKLSYCNINIDSHTKNNSSSSSVISKSLKNLIISNNIFSLSSFADLYRQTSNLRHLSTWFTVEYYESKILKPMYSITRLNIMFYGLQDMLEHLLQNLPNLYKLKCNLNLYINGNEWENIMKKFLPK